MGRPAQLGTAGAAQGGHHHGADERHAKDAKRVLLVETNEGFSTGPKMLSLLDFINWHNPLYHNASQPVSKWAARFALGLSDTIPAGYVGPQECEVRRDTLASSWKRTADSRVKPPAEVILTDGHGTMSAETARRAYVLAGLFDDNRARPACLQVRYGGSKGILSVDPTMPVLRPNLRLSLRDSQVKITWPQETASDRSLHMLELLRPPKIKSPSALTAEVIIVMGHGGVGLCVFQNVLQASLDKIKEDFSFSPRDDPELGTFEGPQDVHTRLLLSCYRYGGVGLDKAKRIMKERGISARGRGISMERMEDDESSSSTTGGATASGPDVSDAEIAVDMLAAGFTVQGCKYLRRKVKSIADAAIDMTARAFRLPIERSMEGFIVTSSLLKPNEIMVTTSSALIDPETQEAMTHLAGDCLVTRHPCKLPTDVRKFKAVYREELAHLKDCVIMSANALKCERSPASYLGGGDYDGDTVQVYWEPCLVTSFQNKADESCLVVPPNSESDYFAKEVASGTDFLQRIAELDKSEAEAEHQRVLLAGLLAQPLAGIYTGLHNAAVYMSGVASPEAIRLAHVLCLCLDAPKSGLQLRPERLAADRQKYDGRIQWVAYRKGVTAEMARQLPDGNVPVIKPSSSGEIIMDQLMSKAIAYRDRLNGDVHFDSPQEDLRCLVVPWDSALTTEDATLRAELLDLHREVKGLSEDWVRAQSLSKSVATPLRRRWAENPATARLRVVQLRYEALAAGRYEPLHADPGHFERWKASCAVKVEMQAQRYRPDQASLAFSFGVARRALCKIIAGHGAVAVSEDV